MLSRLQSWWKAGERDAIAVYRARLLVPLMMVTGITILVFLATLPHKQSDMWFFPAIWSAGAIPLLLRRRRAAIFTPDSFLFRPACGAILKVPISGIKRASEADSGAGEEYGPEVHIELIVGGALDLRLGVLRSEEVITRLDEAARATHYAEDSKSPTPSPGSSRIVTELG